MLDIDGFKALNDTFGHSIGDKALVDMVEALRSVLRADDLIGRLGGDEFMICLMNIQYEAITERKACQICNALRKNFGENVVLSASLGITSYPQDGDNFDELYKKADAALYRAKEIGKDNYVFYNDSMNIDRAVPVQSVPVETDIAKGKRRTRMLIINNKMAERLAIEAIFSEDYFVLKSFNGKNALSLMRCYRSGIGVVILDANLNDIDGYSIVKIMQQEKDLASIPVIMINEGNDPEIERKAIAAGAADFVRKPLDENLLRIRVKNAVNRAENERLRMHNSYLQLQENEEKQFHQVLNATGTVVFTHDWVHGLYTYDPKAKKYMKGNFDKRPLWQILLSDMVAHAMDVKSMHNLVMSVAGNRECDSAEMHVQLKNPKNEWRWFKMQVIKMRDPLGLTNKVIMTFNDITKQVEAEQVLRNKAEFDSLTGLYNRETFFKKASEWIKSDLDHKLIMTCFDIDNFKMINEQYSQNEGDRLLSIIGNFLKEKMQNERILCARIYADNFACLNCVKKIEDGKDLYDSLSEEVKLRYPDQEITISEGRYVIENKKLRVSTMYDKAFYAKKHIKGRYDLHNATFNKKMQKTILLKHDIT
ncbi:MAG: diguanylate cyclase, partial [Fibrobacter sp.]|nr:diguanylate cyclase [Fibrobacter sp.]